MEAKTYQCVALYTRGVEEPIVAEEEIDAAYQYANKYFRDKTGIITVRVDDGIDYTFKWDFKFSVPNLYKTSSTHLKALKYFKCNDVIIKAINSDSAAIKYAKMYPLDNGEYKLSIDHCVYTISFRDRKYCVEDIKKEKYYD